MVVKVQEFQSSRSVSMDSQSQSSISWLLHLPSRRVQSSERAAVKILINTSLITGIYEPEKMKILETTVSLWLLYVVVFELCLVKLSDGKFKQEQVLPLTRQTLSMSVGCLRCRVFRHLLVCSVNRDHCSQGFTFLCY